MLANRVSTGGTLIHSMVGVAIAKMVVMQVETLIENPEAPNLYWALASLPRPLVETRQAFAVERDMLFCGATALPRDGIVRRNAEKVAQAYAQLLADFDKPVRVADFLSPETHPDARAYLSQRAIPETTLDQLSSEELVLSSLVTEFLVCRDQTFKWFSVPAHLAWTGMQEAGEALKRRDADGVPNPFLALLPAVIKARAKFAALERDLAALCCLEAIRMHAAENDGSLPAALDEIRCVPIPNDPIRDRGFAYAIEGDRAVLSSVAPPGSSSRMARRYEITIRP